MSGTEEAYILCRNCIESAGKKETVEFASEATRGPRLYTVEKVRSGRVGCGDFRQGKFYLVELERFSTNLTWLPAGHVAAAAHGNGGSYSR